MTEPDEPPLSARELLLYEQAMARGSEREPHPGRWLIPAILAVALVVVVLASLAYSVISA